jgi:multicomponent Na+:H+ antiporter subunit C
MSILLAATAAALFGVGTYLVLQRKLSRVIVGIGLISHGANVLIITAGRRGIAPLIGRGDADRFADPVPQALALTAIVIAFGVTAFLLALAYRSWLLTHDDEIADDVEDRAVAHQRHDEDTEIADAAAMSSSDPDAEADPAAAHDAPHTGQNDTGRNHTGRDDTGQNPPGDHAGDPSAQP